MKKKNPSHLLIFWMIINTTINFMTVLVTPVKKTFFFLWDLGQTQLFKVNIEYFHIHSIGYGAVAIH